MRTPLDLANDYVSVWNERDPVRRRALLSAGWTSGAVYVDPLAQAAGQEAIAGLIEAVQSRFPEFRFALIGTPDGYGDLARFSWSLAPERADPIVKGTDIVHRQGDLIATVTGFIDQMPVV